MISIICAIGKNKAIGKNNKLLWDIPDDLKHFKKITSGHPVLMGQKTFESIGKPLPNRLNIIMTRDKNFQPKNCLVVYSLEEAIEKANEADNQEIFFIGGGEIYRQALPYADKLYLTIVEDSPEADTFFPDYSEFKNIISEEKHNLNNLNYKFVELTR